MEILQAFRRRPEARSDLRRDPKFRPAQSSVGPKRLWQTALVIACIGLAVGKAWSATYDLVINGGRVLDPASRTERELNVGIEAGRIAALSPTPLE